VQELGEVPPRALLTKLYLATCTVGRQPMHSRTTADAQNDDSRCTEGGQLMHGRTTADAQQDDS